MPRTFPNWLRLPSRIALLIGVGALSAAGARADTNQPLSRSGTEPLSTKERAPTQLRIWSDGERLYISEDGDRGQELRLGDTVEARHLRGLLDQYRAAATAEGMRFDRMILAGGGGDGFHWAPAGKTRDAGDTAIFGAGARSKPKPGVREEALPTNSIAPRKTISERPGVKG
jgi:hypothetical protein